MIDKLRDCFDDMVVYKDLRKTSFFSSLSLPSFMRDWLLQRFADDEGNVGIDRVDAFIRKNLPDKEGWNVLKDRLITEGEQIKILAKIRVEIDIQTAGISFELPDYGLRFKETFIDSVDWNDFKDELTNGRETWGILKLNYRFPDKLQKIEGRIKLVGFENFCPYTIDLEYYKDARREFSFTEWLNVLLGAIDYNADGYEDERQKLAVLTRLLPFVEKRLNLIELAPKGTGKSYLYGRVSRFGWLSSGGVMSRAKMFYDISKKTEGLIAGNDFVVLDEVQTIRFTDVDEMRGALKGYLESGTFTVGNYAGKADAGLVLSGNVSMGAMRTDGYGNILGELPEVFHESALIDRFHGFIKGWDIPRMNDDLKIADWALNSEYFTSILHELREDINYRGIVDELLEVPEAADTRDTEAIKRISTAYLKLFFPNVRDAGDIDPRDFDRYCFRRASEMRDIIKRQLGKLDPEEFGGKDIPYLKVRGL